MAGLRERPGKNSGNRSPAAWFAGLVPLRTQEVNMNNTLKASLLAIGLVFCLFDAAWARPPHYDRGGYSSRHYDYRGSHRYQPAHHNRHRWEAVAATLVVGGLIGAALADRPAPVQAVVVPQPLFTTQPPPPAPPRVWYYCGSAGMYYPQAGFCPEGWRLIQQ